MNPVRLEKLYETIKGGSADAAVITDPSDFFYLSGCKANAVMVLVPGSPVVFLSPVEYEECAAVLSGAFECRKMDRENLWLRVGELVKDRKCAVDPSRLSYTAYLGVKENLPSAVFIEDMVSGMRVVKDPEEIALIRKACGLAAAAVDGLDIGEWAGKTERQLCAHLVKRSWEDGASGPAFVPVVAAGPNSAYPHHEPGDRVIDDGWIKIDFGVVYRNYCSDLTRTYILDKFFSNLRTEELFENLSRAKQAAVDMLGPGVRCGDLHAAAKKVLDDCGLGEHFIHNLGHGVGIDIHEKPYLKPGAEQVLEEGMVVTVEPGIYIPGTGGMRIEDTYLIKSGGNEQLTRIYR
ncbi:MAG: aminopeptidase P family protein [Elusimicrobia bacterium]|nr:aminopeptidase P family protein [Elusimicrobiota bacterium]